MWANRSARILNRCKRNPLAIVSFSATMWVLYVNPFLLQSIQLKSKYMHVVFKYKEIFSDFKTVSLYDSGVATKATYYGVAFSGRARVILV